MAANNANHASMPFWDFLQSLDPNRAAAPGEGVDSHAEPAFPFTPGDLASWAAAWGPRGGGPSAPWGRRGRWGGRGSNPHQPWAEDVPEAQLEAGNNEEDSPDTVHEGPYGPGGTHPPPPPPPPHHGPHPSFPNPPPPHRGPQGHYGPPRPPRCGFGRGGRGSGPCGRGGRGGHREHHRGPPPPYPGVFNLPPWLYSLQNHPLAQAMRQHLQQYTSNRGGEWEGEAGDDVAFNPPVDIFNRPTEWQVHVALPGVKKEDIGVNWDADKSTLNVAGVVNRPGDEEFIQSLTGTCERKVGMFDRSVKLPTADGDEKDEVDSEGISAKFEDGLLMVTVPKVERDWTEIRKVDIE